MRILFYLHRFPGFGGMEAMCGVLTREFLRRGHSVTILSHCSGKGSSIMTELPASVKVYHMPDKDRLVSVENMRYIEKVIKEHQIEIVLYRDSYAKIEKNLLGRNLPVKIITSEHNAPFFCYEGAREENGANKKSTLLDKLRSVRAFFRPAIYKVEGKRKRFLYDKSDRYVLLSNRFYGEFKCVARLFDARKLRAIPNPLAPELAQEEMDFSDKEDLCVFAGTLSREKGALRALKAFKMLKDQGRLSPTWKFEILGDGLQRAECEAYVRKHEMSFVAFKGYEANVGPYFRRAKIFIFPSSREGWGNVLIEAMSNKAVPIAFNSYSAVYDIIKDRNNGRLINAFDTSLYAEALYGLMHDPVGLQNMAVEAQRVRELYDCKVIADRWESLMAETLEEGFSS